VNIIMKRNLKVYIEEKNSVVLELRFSCFFSNAVSGIEIRTMNMKMMIEIVPQKKEISIASFLLTS